MASRHSANTTDTILRQVVAKELLGRRSGGATCVALPDGQAVIRDLTFGANSGLQASTSFDPRLDPGIKGTDVTAEQNCAGMQWFQHDSSKDSAGKLVRRLHYVTTQPQMEGSPSRRPNTLLGGGFSDFESWSTSSGAAHSPKVTLPGAGRLAVGTGTFGIKSTDVTSEHSCAGMQWFQHDSSADSPDGHVRRRRFAPPLVPADCADSARSAAAASWSPAVPRQGAGFGMRSTDVTMKHNCAGLQWFQHDSSADSNEELVRRMRFAPVKEGLLAASAAVAAPASARSDVGAGGPRVGPLSPKAGSLTAR